MNRPGSCAACHKLDGSGFPPIYPPLQADSVAVGGSVARHIDIVVQGIPGTAMQAFGLQLSDLQIASIVTYERNAWDNNTGDVVQPSTVAIQKAKFAKEKEKKIKEKEAKSLQKLKKPTL